MSGDKRKQKKPRNPVHKALINSGNKQRAVEDKRYKEDRRVAKEEIKEGLEKSKPSFLS